MLGTLSQLNSKLILFSPFSIAAAMRFKLTLFLLLANFAVFFALWRLERPAPLTLKPSGLIDFAPDHITITDHTQNEVRELERGTDGNWQLLQPMKWAANDHAAQHLITQLTNPEEQSSFSTEDMASSGEKLSQYGLDKPRIEVTVGGAGGRKVVLEVGTHTLAGNNLYVMNPADHLVRVWTDDFLQSLETPVAELRNNQIFSVKHWEVQDLSIWSLEQRAEQNDTPNAVPNLVRFSREAQDNNLWQLETPLQRPADSQMVNSVVGQLNNLLVVNFLPPTEVNLARQGLANPLLSVELKGENVSQKLLLGALVPNTTEPQYYAKREDSEAVFTVKAGEPFDTLRQAQEKLRERKFFDFDPEKVSAITVQASDTELRLQKKESGESPWKVLTKDATTGAPTTWTADLDVIRLLLGDLRSLTAKKFASDAPHDLSAYGLDQPIRKVSLQLEKTTRTLSIGHTKDPPLVYYAKSDISDSVYEVEGDIIRELSIEPLNYRDRTFAVLPATDQIVSLRLLRLNDDLSDDGGSVFDFSAETRKGLEDQFGTRTQTENQNLHSLCDWLAKTVVDSYLKAPFDEHKAAPLYLGNSTVPVLVPWRYRLEVGIQTPATAQSPAQNRSLIFYFTENIGGLEAGGIHTPSESAVFKLPISIVRLLEALTHETNLSPEASKTLQEMKQPIDTRVIAAPAASPASTTPAQPITPVPAP